MSKNLYKCIVTGEEKYIAPSIAKKKIDKFGSVPEFKKHYVSPAAAKLLRSGQSVDEIREAQGIEGLPDISPIILTKQNLMRKKPGLRMKESQERLERAQYLNSKEFKDKMRALEIKRQTMTFQEKVEEMTGGPNGCQRELGGTCIRPDIFLDWNDRACDGCKYYEYCMCYNKRLSHEKRKPKRR